MKKNKPNPLLKPLKNLTAMVLRLDPFDEERRPVRAAMKALKQYSR